MIGSISSCGAHCSSSLRRLNQPATKGMSNPYSNQQGGAGASAAPSMGGPPRQAPKAHKYICGGEYERYMTVRSGSGSVLVIRVCDPRADLCHCACYSLPFSHFLSGSRLPLASGLSDCNTDNEIRAGEPIRCKECGYRIMYKPRTTRMVSV